jgi:hypothetical protein
MTESILQEAQRIIHGDRNVAYGHPIQNFQAIAHIWNGYIRAMGEERLNVDGFSPQDVANMMILMKIGRVCNDNYHRDSYVDVAGYAGTAERMQEPAEALAAFAKSERVASPLRVWQGWDTLNGPVVKDILPNGFQVRGGTGRIWTLHKVGESELVEDEHQWLWSVDKNTIKDYSPGSYRAGPFTEIRN